MNVSIFGTYLGLGFDHILDWNGYDHMLFVTTLAVSYHWKDWKKMAILITAFTLGHSLTLLMSVMHWISYSSSIIELLIPITIAITAALNIWNRDHHSRFSYFLVLFFGLIHGLGFSNYLKILLDDPTQIVFPLFAFNLGIEMGQLLLLIFFNMITFLIVKAGIEYRRWKIGYSIFSFVISLYLITKQFL